MAVTSTGIERMVKVQVHFIKREAFEENGYYRSLDYNFDHPKSDQYEPVLESWERSVPCMPSGRVPEETALGIAERFWQKCQNDFGTFPTGWHPTGKRSMMTGDVVQIGGDLYMVASMGFRRVGWDQVEPVAVQAAYQARRDSSTLVYLEKRYDTAPTPERAALKVFVLNPEIRAHLMANDPQALKQARSALGLEEMTSGPR